MTKQSQWVPYILGIIFISSHSWASDPNSVSEESFKGTTASNSPLKPDSDLLIRTDDDCFNVKFDVKSSEQIACNTDVQIQYTHRNCQTANVIESGEVTAKSICTDEGIINLKFKTTKGVVNTTVFSKRTEAGRQGVVSIYTSSKTIFEKSSEPLKDPILKPIDGSIPESAPIRYLISGFGSAEVEQSQNFGYDGVTNSPNFLSTASAAKQSNMNFLSNLQLEVQKDRSSLTTVLEIGEVFAGDPGTGGDQGARKRVAELRNLFLTQYLNEWLGVKVGVFSLSSDPRSFIVSDHYSAVMVNYLTDLVNGNLWYAWAHASRAGTSAPQAERYNHYLGGSGSLQLLSGIKHTFYGVLRNVNESQTDGATSIALPGRGTYAWGGLTAEYGLFGPILTEFSLILNMSQFKSDSGLSDNGFGYLADLKATYSWSEPQVDFSIEGLVTSGQSEPLTIGKRNNFNSPDPGAGYLLTIATSDGGDDAPGSAKESIVANLNQTEGLMILALKVSKNISRRLSGFVRAGKIGSAHPRQLTNSTEIGQEADLGAVYQLSPGTILQWDLAQMWPGAYYTTKDPATLMATKLKFSF